ncbi:MAG: class II aldolase/adducin family protein [Endomicrobiales bacterium]
MTLSRMYRDFQEYGRLLFEQGLNNSHSGNMSARKGGVIYITRHGARLGSLSPRDIVAVNLNDAAKDRGASLEVTVHRAVYRACEEVDAVVHAHNPYAVALSLGGKDIRPVDSEGQYYLPQVPVLSCRKTISSCEVAEGLPPLISRYRAALVCKHGAFAGGKDIEEAALLVSVLESASKILYLSRSLR